MSATTRGTGRWAARSAGLGTHSRAARRAAGRAAAALGIVAAVAAGGLGSLVAAQPAHAVTAEADIEAKIGNNTVQGKAGGKASVGYQVSNNGKVDARVTVTIQVPSNAEIEAAGGCTVAGNRRAASCPLALKAGASANGSVQVVLKTAGEGDGAVIARLSPNQNLTDPKDGNNAARFKVRVTGASATPSTSKSSRSSRSASADPAGTSDEVAAPPEAGNGAIPREEPTTRPVSDSGGLGFGFWVGVVAIVAALGLVGSLFYFRRKDRLEPDTGVFHMPTAGRDSPTSVITPGVYGSPAAAPAFQNGPAYGQGFQPGQGAPGGSNVYGAPPAPPATYPPSSFPPPAFPPPAAPPMAAPPPAAPPAANDQTVIMRRPDDL